MKKFLLVIVAMLFILPVFSNTAQLEILGNVSGFLSIAVDEPTRVLDLDPLAGEETHFLVTVTERSNKPGGYEVRVSSDRDFQLVSWNGAEFNPEFSVPYDFTYDGVRVHDPSGVVLITDTLGRTTGQGVLKGFSIHTNVPEDNPQGSYRDVITFTISSK